MKDELLKMRAVWSLSVQVMLISLYAGVCLPVSSALSAENWHVKEARVRFTVSIDSFPSHPSCGYFLHIPDGGILPGPSPLTHVVDESGKPLKSYVLWQNPETGVAVVFEAPGSGQKVYVYVSGAAQLKIWNQTSGLTPSAIICTQSGAGSRVDASKLGMFGKVDAKVHWRNKSGSGDSGVALPGDRSGRHGPCAMYMLAYMAVADAGPTWFAPMSRGGEVEFSIDGKKITPAKVNDKPGGSGQKVNLTAGLHRLDGFGWTDAKGGTGPVFLMIRAPKDTVAELGGERPKDLKYAGTPMLEARNVKGSEVAKSGSCKVENVETSDGGPVAVFKWAPSEVFWFADETPTVLCKLSAIGDSASKTEYSWSFSCDPSAVARGRKVQWILPCAGVDTRVTLKAVNGDKKSECTVPIYPFSDTKTSLENPSTREEFRTAVVNMITSYPTNSDPVARWDASMWNNLFRTADLEDGSALLTAIFSPDRWDCFSKKLTNDKKELLEDMYFVVVPRLNPKSALEWADRLGKNNSSKTRPSILKLRAAEIYMYYLKDFESARKLVKPLISEPGEVGEMAKIRLGDIEFLSRTNMSAATQLYGEVQNKAKFLSKAAESAVTKKVSAPTGLARSKKEMQGKKNAEPEAAAKPSAGGDDPAVAKWKKDAVRDVAASEKIKTLMAQRFYLESYQELKRWERGFPLSKISGDYILLEARLYMILHDYGRARMLLESYCEQVDASNFLGEALSSIKDCMLYMKEPDATINKYLEKARKRMQFQEGNLSF